jgi:hypothetical protein
MTETIRQQILAVRASGACNMFSLYEVQRIAYDMDFFELVCFIEEDRKAYVRFILTGKSSEDN